jgi:hypothetical protein
MNTLESRSKIPGKCLNAVLENNIEDQLDRFVRNEEVLQRFKKPKQQQERRLTGLVTY